MMLYHANSMDMLYIMHKYEKVKIYKYEFVKCVKCDFTSFSSLGILLLKHFVICFHQMQKIWVVLVTHSLW